MTLYNKLLKFIEDLEDSLDLKHAIETNTGFIAHNELLSHLKKQNLKTEVKNEIPR